MCDCNFDPQIGFIKNIKTNVKKEITILEYLKNKKLKERVKNGKSIIICENGNELVKWYSTKRRSHFYHKSSNPQKMCEWHKEWQNNFDNKEVHIGNRIADVLVDDLVLEFQHSKISKDLVNTRNKNYTDSNKQIYWIIDCCDNESVQKTDLGNRHLIYFKKDLWKYESFIDCDFIYLDFGTDIVKICPKKVVSNMIFILNINSKENFINAIKNKINIWDDKEDAELSQCVLYHNQRGAGCGKTYESIQLLEKDKRFKHKTTYIYLTKMHSAKEVIYNELKEQEDRGLLSSLKFKKSDKDELGIVNKQIKINYQNEKLKKYCTIIIGTIDSFMYTIGNKNVSGNDYFYEIVKSICGGFVNTNKNGGLKYAQENIKINQNCLIIIDEAQDLGPEYIEAIGKIMGKTCADTYVIGDKLQSIWDVHNIHTFLENNNLPSIKIERNTGINQVMRFHNEQFIDLVNKLVQFEKYNLPPITKICENKNCKYEHENNIKPYIFLNNQQINYNDDSPTNMNNIIKYINEQIIDNMKKEINNYGYLPNNFMFIFPVLSNNQFAIDLELRIQNFWIEQFSNEKYQKNILEKNKYWKNIYKENKFHKFIYLHKSEGNKPINLKESENASRILSIHASKGNGCEVVFLLGMSDITLKKFSKGEKNLVYDSLLHVALTRQKKKIYIQPNEIYKNINTDYMCNLNSIRKTIQIGDIIEFSKEKKFECINDNFIKLFEYDKLIPDNRDQKEIIEWGHHIIRNLVYKYNIIFNIVNNEKIKSINNEKINNNYDQIRKMLEYIKKSKIEFCNWDEYIKYLKNEGSKSEIIKIFRYDSDNKSKYYKYSSIILNFINNIKNKINNDFKKIPYLCPLESVIFMYLIETYIKGIYTNITIGEVYTILYYYDECFNTTCEHEKYKCVCNNEFIGDNKNTEKYKDIQNSVKNHYEKTKKVKRIYKNYIKYISEKYKDELFKYIISPTVWFGGKTDDFQILTNNEIIAYSKNYVILFIITPQFNKLNFNDIYFTSIFNEYITYNQNQTYQGISGLERNVNYKNFNGKQIITCILTLDSEEPIFITFHLKKEDVILKNIFKDAILDKYKKYIKDIIYYYKYCKNPENRGNINSIEYTCNNLKDCKKTPSFIYDYFNEIHFEVKKCKNYNERQEILKKVYIDETINYDNYGDYEKNGLFVNGLIKNLENSINKYLGIVENDLEDY